MSKIFYGIWIYSILCLILVNLYGYRTELFEPKLFDYNLSFWSALIVNIVLLCISIIALKGPKIQKIIPIIGIIITPISTYLFYASWTQINYTYLAGFIVIPFVLLLLSIIIEKKYHTKKQI